MADRDSGNMESACRLKTRRWRLAFAACSAILWPACGVLPGTWRAERRVRRGDWAEERVARADRPCGCRRGSMASRAQQLRGILGRTRRACSAATSRDSLLSATWQLAVASDTSLLATRPAHGVAAPCAAGNAAAAGGGTGGAASKAAAATLLQPAEAVAVHLHLQASAPVGLRSLRALECIPPQSALLPHAVPPSPAHALLCKPWGSQPQQPLLGWPRVQVVGGGRMSLSPLTAAAFHSCAQPQQLSAALFLRLPRGMRPLVLRPVEAATGVQQHRWYAAQGSSHKDSSSSGRREVVRQEEEDVFSSITDKIPERPVSAAEGASYSIVILAALAVAAGAAYFVVKELLLEPKEYKVFNKALQRVQNDPQVISRLGSPITGYGQESRNRAARQRISHRVWTDEEGVERIQVQFHIRGTGGTGLVHAEMFRDSDDGGAWKFTYLLVDVMSPSPARLMLESYVPA
ncbi:unnamed protein product [Closterium sp. Naga37s-1]|nr:unnamed protein product [Closterium sp. Naga37s-1]